MEAIKFGFWPQSWKLNAGRIKIQPLTNFDELVGKMDRCGQVSGSWFYPPLTRAHDPKLAPEASPQIPATVYSLTATHELETTEKEFGEFVIALVGLLTGLRLIPEKWKHFYRTAIKPNAFSDLICHPEEIERVIGQADVFWHTSNSEVKRLIFGAIHWRSFCESYQHEFERFGGQYTVLDTCYRIYRQTHPRAPRKDDRHAERPGALAKAYGLKVPPWAIIQPTNSLSRKTECSVSELRNAFFHEGLYGKEPIGFGYPDEAKFSGPIDLQLGNFNTRLILAIIGVKCGYVRSAVDDRNIRGLDLTGTK